MNTRTNNLLVVDDEQVVCDSCVRILGDRGFNVETMTDPIRGLDLATQHNYGAILLDIKMPELDGFEFLERLRKKKSEMPVIMITGYPSVQHATMAMQLGSVDFITKPFTPREILDAVNRALEQPYLPVVSDYVEPIVELPLGIKTIPSESKITQPILCFDNLYFKDEAWVQYISDNAVRVGTFLPSEEAETITSVKLPCVGDIVYQGLPLVSFDFQCKQTHIIPAPISGKVVSVNQSLAHDYSRYWKEGYDKSWIAHIIPTSFRADIAACKMRNVILATKRKLSAKNNMKILSNLGCCVHKVDSLESISEILLYRKPNSLLIIDESSFGTDTLEVVRLVAEALRHVKVVVLASPSSRLEADYRSYKILYYAIEPVNVAEYMDILHSAFKPMDQYVVEEPSSSFLPEYISALTITNRNAKKIKLLAPGGVLLRHRGVGLVLCQDMLRYNYPLTTTFGAKELRAINFDEESDDCDRLIIIESKDAGGIPGAILSAAHTQLSIGLNDIDNNIRIITIQPPIGENKALVFDQRTSRDLAEFIFREMTVE